jgi:hypothetical protein
LYTTHGDCHPLIKLDKPFCKHYGFKLDKYVKAWEDEEQEQYNHKGQNISVSRLPNYIPQTRFAHSNGRHYAFQPQVDLNLTGARFSGTLGPKKFRAKNFCKESCLHFTNEYSMAWKYILLSSYAEALISCLEKPSKNDGDSSECMYYDRKESLEKEGKFVWSVGPWHIRRAVGQAFGQTIGLPVFIKSASQLVSQSTGRLVGWSVISHSNCLSVCLSV